MSESELLTRLDMGDEEYVKDAAHELRRAGSDTFRLATWAAKWGDPALLRCQAAIGLDDDKSEEIEELEGELKLAEEKRDELTDAIEAAVKAFDNIDFDGDRAAAFKAAADVIGKLEGAL